MTLVYFRDGNLVHTLPPAASPNDGGAALCGRTPWPDSWFGTGTQDEHDKARTMPVCVSCNTIAQRQRGLRNG